MQAAYSPACYNRAMNQGCAKENFHGKTRQLSRCLFRILKLQGGGASTLSSIQGEPIEPSVAVRVLFRTLLLGSQRHIKFYSTLRPTSEFSLPDSRQSTFASRTDTSAQRRRRGLQWRNENTHVRFTVSQTVVHTTVTVVKQLAFDHKIQQRPWALKVEASTPSPLGFLLPCKTL